MLGDGLYTPPGLLSHDALQALLERERMRSDRSGATFSLAVFSIAEEDGELGEDTLIRLLIRRLRATDDAGRMADGRLATLLPETDIDGAWTLVDELAEMYAQYHLPLECEVFCYPAADSRRQRETIRRREPPRPSSDVDHAEPTEPITGGDGGDTREQAGASAFRRPWRSLEAIFSVPIPWWKRIIDVVGASVLLVLTLPVMLAAAAAIKLTSRGPVLFAQARSGLAGRPFTMYKLRTMAVDAETRKAELRQFSEQDGPAFKMTHDPRITAVGRFLRTASIDELPQLWNVLRGEMSLVGPRPLPVDESAACAPWQKRRLDVTPGLTCTWQVSGRSLVTFADWVRMDLRYAQRRTLIQDLRLILLTIPAVLLRRGK
jgi:lipopolysaccharide/colanic/teichoic acid biosynthesis glycosyltransferase